MARTFPGLRQGEHVVAWINTSILIQLWNLLRILGVLLVMLIPAAFFAIDTLSGTLETSVLLLETILFMGTLLFMYQSWIDTEFDSFILTNERLFDVTQNGIFSIKISATSLDLIQNASGSEKGFFGNILRLGTLTIQTAARETLEIHNVFQPASKASMIQRIKDDYIKARKRHTRSTDPDQDNLASDTTEDTTEDTDQLIRRDRMKLVLGDYLKEE